MNKGKRRSDTKRMGRDLLPRRRGNSLTFLVVASNKSSLLSMMSQRSDARKPDGTTRERSWIGYWDGW